MSAKEKLCLSLKIRFGTAPNEPDSSQIDHILHAISSIASTGREPTEQDWANAVARFCPSTDSYHYSGLDNSDLNTLLALAIQQSK